MPEEPVPHEPASDPPAPHQPAAHQPEGLDLARAFTRAAAGSTPRRRARKRAAAPPPGKRASSGAHPDERDPQTLESTVGRIVDQHGWELDLRVHAVFARWPELVGDEIAAHSTPESFADGRLVVRTDSTAWATQLTLLAATVVRRLNEELGHGSVTVIDVQGPHGPTWKKGPRSVRDGRGPRDTYG